MGRTCEHAGGLRVELVAVQGEALQAGEGGEHGEDVPRRWPTDAALVQVQGLQLRQVPQPPAVRSELCSITSRVRSVRLNWRTVAAVNIGPVPADFLDVLGVRVRVIGT
jgi:hypothetical protein